MNAICTDQDIAGVDLAVLERDCGFVWVDVNNFTCSVKDSWVTVASGLCSCFESLVEVCTVNK